MRRIIQIERLFGAYLMVTIPKVDSSKFSIKTSLDSLTFCIIGRRKAIWAARLIEEWIIISMPSIGLIYDKILWFSQHELTKAQLQKCNRNRNGSFRPFPSSKIPRERISPSKIKSLIYSSVPSGCKIRLHNQP